jgi:hypothetical protein
VIKVRKKKKKKENTPKFLTNISGTKQKFIIIIFMELACGDGRYFFVGAPAARTALFVLILRDLHSLQRIQKLYSKYSIV